MDLESKKVGATLTTDFFVKEKVICLTCLLDLLLVPAPEEAGDGGHARYRVLVADPLLDQPVQGKEPFKGTGSRDKIQIFFLEKWIHLGLNRKLYCFFTFKMNLC